MPIISDSKKFIGFLSTKSGSETLKRRLGSHHTREPSLIHNWEKKEYTVDQFGDTALINDYFTFTFVRNPYERFYSAYIHLIQYWTDTLKLEESFGKTEFSCVYTQLVVSRPLLMTFENRGFHGAVTHAIYGKYFDWPAPNYGWAHKEDRFCMNFVGRLEQFEDDFDRLCRTLDIQPDNRENVHVRTSLRKSYKYLHRYTPETIARVNELYQVDFEAFGYKMLAPGDFKNHIYDVFDLPPINHEKIRL